MFKPFVIAVVLAATSSPSFAETEKAAQVELSVPTKHVTHTYLRAAPGKRDALIAYIERNWFAMDRIGIEQGLFTNYALLVRPENDASDWDVIVTIGYPTSQGHDAPGVADAFKAIRAAHREVKIEGLGQKELATIVQHHALLVAHRGL